MAQEITSKNAIGAPLKNGEIRGNDMTTVYSTDVDKFHKTGEAMEVHVELAKKLVEKGKASYEKPKGEYPKPSKKDKE